MLLECGCTPKGAAQRMNLNGAARNQTLCDVPCGNGSWRFQNGTRLGDDGKEGFVAPKTAIIQSTIVHYLHSTRTRTRARETRGVVVLARKGNVHGGAQPAVTARAHVATRVAVGRGTCSGDRSFAPSTCGAPTSMRRLHSASKNDSWCNCCFMTSRWSRGEPAATSARAHVEAGHKDPGCPAEWVVVCGQVGQRV